MAGPVGHQLLSPLVGRRRHRPHPAARLVVLAAEARRAQAGDQQWVAVLEHEKIPFISYPYEWSFEMLRDAALLQLDLVLAGLDEGIGLKGASACNLQWKGVAPVFVDVASFYKRAEGEPWVGYRQFCQMFLYPLLVQAYKDVPFQPRGGCAGACVPTGKSAEGVQRDNPRRAQGFEQGRVRQAHHQGQTRRAFAHSSPAFNGSRSSLRGQTI
jgi:hypothetical protein